LIDCDKSVTVEFIEDFYNLTINIVGNGSVFADIVGPYTYGDIVELTAIADSNWTFDHWSGNLSGNTTPVNITMDGDKSVTAFFTEIGGSTYYMLSITIVGNGVVIPSGGIYEEGTIVSLNAIADSGWEFSHWSGNATGTNPNVDITMDSDKSVTATFTIIQIYYNLIISISGNGSTDPDVGIYSVLNGYMAIINATPDIGWSFINWSGDINSLDNPVSITITDDTTVCASFSITPDTEPPSNITNLTVTDTKDEKLDISWDSATDQNGINHYEIHRDGFLLVNITATSYQDTGLINDQLYSYQVRAVDNAGNKGNLSVPVSGTPTETKQNKNSDNDNDPPPPPTNYPPVADAGGPYIGFINQTVTFNGSNSYTLDNTEIIGYRWDFNNDGIYDTEWLTEPTTQYSYANPGEYIITLTVKDIDDETDLDVTSAIINETINNPPINLTIIGQTNGTETIEYYFTLNAIDPDNSNSLIRYIINWGDNGDLTISEYILSETPIDLSHIWQTSGVYNIPTYAEDEYGERSEEIALQILIEDLIILNSNTNNQQIAQHTQNSILGLSVNRLILVLIIAILIITLLIVLTRNKKEKIKKPKKKRKRNKEKTEKAEEKTIESLEKMEKTNIDNQSEKYVETISSIPDDRKYIPIRIENDIEPVIVQNRKNLKNNKTRSKKKVKKSTSKKNPSNKKNK